MEQKIKKETKIMEQKISNIMVNIGFRERSRKNWYEKLKDLKTGKYDYIFTTNIDKLINDIEKGRPDTRIREMFKESFFEYKEDYAEDIFRVILRLKELLSYEDEFLKNSFIYEKDKEMEEPTNTFSGIRYTYGEAMEIFKLAHEILDDGRIYLLLDFYLQNGKIIEELVEREDAIRETAKNRQAFDVINGDEYEIGIITIKEKFGEIRDRHEIGTKKELLLSEILGIPFPKDIDEPGYDYGNHGEQYMPPHVIRKTFRAPINEREVKSIDLEMQKRRLMKSKIKKETMGYIKGLVISDIDLLNNGLSLTNLRWKPLKVEKTQRRKFKLYKSIEGDLKNALKYDYVVYPPEYDRRPFYRALKETAKSIEEERKKRGM